MKTPSKVIIVGGTHGNEWTGIKVVQHYQDYFLKKFPKLSIEFIFANPQAYKANSRFVGEDLNRAFQYLSETRSSYEHRRAKEIKEIIEREECLVIDLHTTTANMGNTLIVSQYNPMTLSLCSHLVSNFSDCRVIGAPDPNKKYLASQSTFGLIIEVGPVPNSVVAASALESTLKLIESALSWLGSPKEHLSGTLPIYEEVQDIHYPLTADNALNGYIHSDLQGKDFRMVEENFAAFKTFSGEEVRITPKEKLFPIFINEAAYYPQQLAFTLCRMKTLSF